MTQSTNTTLTAAQKIAAIETSEMSVAWDGCHKIYLLPTDAQERDARANEYDIYPSANIRQMIEDSCSLVFVSLWGMADGVWTNELTFEQFDRDLWLLFWPEAVEAAENDEEN